MKLLSLGDTIDFFKKVIKECRMRYGESIMFKYSTRQIESSLSYLIKLQAIQSNTPPTTDWEHYADKLYDAAYRRGYEEFRDEIDEMLCVMLESDPRTFSNPVSDNGLYYDAIADVLKKLREFHSGTDSS